MNPTFKRFCAAIAMICCSAFTSCKKDVATSQDADVSKIPQKLDRDSPIPTSQSARIPLPAETPVTMPKDRAMGDDIRELLNDLNSDVPALKAKLEIIGPGRDRESLLKNLLYEVSVDGETLKAGRGEVLLTVLDSIAIKGDDLSGPSLTRIVTSLGPSGGIKILERLSSVELRRAIAGSVGDLYGDAKEVPKVKDLTDLDKGDRVVIYSAVGNKMIFSSAPELTQFLKTLDQKQEEYSALAGAALKANSNISGRSLIEEAATITDPLLRSQVYNQGFSGFLRDDRNAAIDYLSTNKVNLDPALYKRSVEILVSVLQRVASADPETKLWQNELESISDKGK